MLIAEALVYARSAALLALAACATAPPPPHAELARELEAAVGAEAAVIPFEVDPVWVRKARAELVLLRSPESRAQHLIDLLNDPNGFGVEYDADASLTANEALAARRGNCFSYAAILVGLARALGMRAEFAEFEHEETRYERWKMIVRSGHVTAVINTPDGYVAMEYGYGIRRRWEVISDREAVAHYYNNRGFMRLADADRARRPLPWDEAAADFERSVKLVDDFYRGWNNLGVAMSRLGREDIARTHYERALAYEPTAATAHLNLGVLLLRRGEIEGAVEHFKRAATLSPDDARAERLEGLALGVAERRRRTRRHRIE